MGLEVLYTTPKFYSVGDQTQSLMQARQALYQLNYIEVPLTCSPIAFSYYLARPTCILSMDALLLCELS